MSQENVEIVRGFLDVGFPQGFEAAFECLDPQVQVDWSQSDGPLSDTYAGHDGFRKLSGSFQEAFEEVWMEPHEFIAAGPHVVVPNTTHFRGRQGVEVIARGTLVFTVTHGKIVSIRAFPGPSRGP